MLDLKQEVALGRLKRASHSIIVEATKVDPEGGITGTQLTEIMRLKSEIADAVAVLCQEIGR